MNKPSCIKYISWNFKIPRFWKIGSVCASRLLRVWSIIPLFMQKISTRVVSVNVEHPRFYPVLQLWGFCGFEALYPFLRTRFPPGWFVYMVKQPLFYPVLQLWGFCGFEVLYPFLRTRFPPGWFVYMVKQPLFYPVLQLWGFCEFEVLYPFLRTRFPPGWFA